MKPPTMDCRFFPVFLIGLAMCGSPAQGAEWIWATPEREAGQSACLRRHFQLDSRPATAHLRCVADFAAIELWLNGQLVASLEPFSGPYAVDVAPLLQPGENRFTAQAKSTAGPAALALQLELQWDDGRRQALDSDGSWQGFMSNDPTDAADLDRIPADSGAWHSVATFGALDSVFLPTERTRNVQIHEIDDYTQWKQALTADDGGAKSASAPSFEVPAGFQLEQLRLARPDEGSWVSLEFDPRGRLIVAREERGLLRMTLPTAAEADGEIRVETIDDTLLECRGLLWAHDCLYANANNSKGLYRLRDTDGDDQLDEVKLLYASAGGVGHGRNDLALGPDGKIYSIQGDSVALPQGLLDRTPPFLRDAHPEAGVGHLLRFDPDGSPGEIVARGLRNPYGIDFNADGELLTYDADAEFDMGTPWYRPTRVVHLVSGADYGWRAVTGNWPPYVLDRADATPPTLDIGKGSPTAVKFGKSSRFRPPFREALFILDWAYGRIIAVHLEPRGAGYAARAETFLRGRPLNVTDLGFGPDGAMYFVTGGRKTQSGLYRLRYVGPAVEPPPPTAQQQARRQHAVQARLLRRRLESLHMPQALAAALEPEQMTLIWQNLSDADPLIRAAARAALEHRPTGEWTERALNEPQPQQAVMALLALARQTPSAACEPILRRLNELSWDRLNHCGKGALLRCYELCLGQASDSAGPIAQLAIEQLLSHFPSADRALNWQLGRVLLDHSAPAAVDRSWKLLLASTEQAERMEYMLLLRGAKVGWTEQTRRDYFAMLGELDHYQGGEGLPGFVERIRADALASLEPAERPRYESLWSVRDLPAEELAPAEGRQAVRQWQLADLVDTLPEVSRGRNYRQGSLMFAAALCVRCHRVAGRGAAIGPDLTSIGSRFSRRDILQSIVIPSQVVAEQYRRAQVVLQDGRVLTGQILPDRDYRSPTLRLAPDPLQPAVMEISKAQVESYTMAPISVMPENLLNTLSREEILDLLAWLEAGGDERHPDFQGQRQDE